MKLHWLGKKQLAAEANATNFMAIWNKPESVKLEVQTLDKLSTAPWRLLKAATPLSNAPVKLLRRLLDDLVQAESYLEVHGSTNQPGEFVMAIRLDAARAALWQTNLPVVFQSLVARNVELTRSGDWTLLALSDSRLRTQDSKLLAEFQSRIQRDGTPFVVRATNYWLELQATAPRLSEALQLGWRLPPTFPGISLTVTGDGLNVLTRGELNCDQPLPEPLEPWRVPLNLTAEPLIGLTAMRSATPLLQRLGILSQEQATHFPDQFLLWLRSGPPLQIHFAIPSNDATNAFSKIAPPIMDWVNSHTISNIYGSIIIDTNRSELKWNGLSLCAPYLKVGTSTNAESSYLQGGFGLMPARTRVPGELHAHLMNGTNLLYFDWEFTAETLPQWRYLDDVSRMIFDAAHASRLRASRNSLEWLLVNVTNLSHSVTELRLSRSNQLALTRKSTLGLSAVELDILINWIEMPDFPRGMSTLWRTNPVPLTPFRLTNAPAGAVK